MCCVVFIMRCADGSQVDAFCRFWYETAAIEGVGVLPLPVSLRATGTSALIYCHDYSR